MSYSRRIFKQVKGATLTQLPTARSDGCVTSYWVLSGATIKLINMAQIVLQKNFTVMEEKMKATRYNGRSGKHGSYNPKHNDRNFDLEHSEHIDANMAMQNIYWDCYKGKRTATSNGNYDSFDVIELRFYEENYSEFVENQNNRNAMNRHTERNRTVEDIYQNKKTCPEESIYQLGNIESSVDPKILVQITEDFLAWMKDKFGGYVHILDWSLHVDEATPHIHERHVFDAPNDYAEIAPQQDRALENLGFELPNPKKPKSKSNNRKMVFDATCRNRFLEICEEYGLSVDKEAEYGGKKYLEKNDFIIQNQKIRIENVNKEYTKQKEKLDTVNTDVAAIDTIIDCLATTAYEATCAIVVAPSVKSVINQDVKDAKGYMDQDYDSEGYWISSTEKSLIKKTLTGVIDKIKSRVEKHIGYIQGWFMEPDRKEKNVERLKQSMWTRLNHLATEGPMREELVVKESMTNEQKNQVAEHTQEVATHIVRRGRGR